MERTKNIKRWMIGLLTAFLAIGAWGYKQQLLQNDTDAVFITQGFQLGLRLKQASTAFYDKYGKLPSSNQEVGLAETNSDIQNGLKRTEITTNGVIELTYDIKTGIDGGVISLTPTIMQGMLKWHCETRDYPNISQVISQCTYQPEFDTERVIVEQVKNILPLQHVDSKK